MPTHTYQPIENQHANMDNMHEKWFRPNIDSKVLKQLTKRSNTPGWLNTISYFLLLFSTGYVAYLSWGTWWAIPLFFIFGTVYSFAAARWHEYGHRSVFKTRWLNDFFYDITSFLTYFEPVSWRWSHTHHHSRTIHIKDTLDFEALPRPVDATALFVTEVFSIKRIYYESKKIILHSLGIMTQVAIDCVPESERPRMIWTSRIWVVIILGTIFFAFLIGSFLPIMYVVFPAMYGWPLVHFTAMLQHGGLKANSWDHRESTRTVILNPIHGWLLYFNMQYHVEHHLFPQVPFYNLPKLHKIIKDQLPPANPNFYHGLKEMIPALFKQSKDPEYYVIRDLPE